MYGETCFNQKMFTNRLNMSLPQQARVEKISLWAGNINSSVKKNCQI